MTSQRDEKAPPVSGAAKAQRETPVDDVAALGVPGVATNMDQMSIRWASHMSNFTIAVYEQAGYTVKGRPQ